MRPDFVLAGVIRRLGLVLGSGVLVALAACGASKVGEPPASPSERAVSAKGAGDGGASSAATAAADAAPPGKPFAGSPTEAMQLIGTAIDKHGADVKKCVAEHRTRKNVPHERVEISVGIDQEGRLLGAALKGGKQDPPFSECVQKALANAPFPRSHAGVIQMTKSYEEIEQ